MTEAWILDAVRTPIGSYGGVLSTVRPDDLAAHTIEAVVERTGAPAAAIDDVYLGCTNRAGEDNRNVARMAGLLAGLRHEVPGVTYAMLKPERGLERGERTMADSTIGWRFVNPALAARHSTESMGETAENVAERHGIAREDQDRFALESHRRAIAAREAGRWRDELIPVEVPRRRGDPEVVEADEGPRPDTSLDRLAALRPVFREGGTVTAGNSSGINDGAACMLLGTAEWAARVDRTPLARIVAAAVAGVDPAVMGIGPVPAVRRVLDRAGLSMDDIDLVELNEAFAAQVLACVRDLEIDPQRLNVNGGAIALGHQLGYSGARILATLCWELRRRGGRFGLATMCVGVGQGLAVIVENADGR